MVTCVSGNAIEQLGKAYVKLDERNDKLHQSLVSDLEASRLKAYLPLCQCEQDIDQQRQAIDAMTRMMVSPIEDGHVRAGLMCVSKRSINHAEKLNEAKSEFSEAVKLVREEQGVLHTSNKGLTKMVGNHLEKGNRRSEKVALALTRIGQTSLDLKRCYTKIRVLPSSLESISWTWAKKHSRDQQFTWDEVDQMIERMIELESDARETAKRLLAGCAKDEIFVKHVPLHNQLRANCVFNESGERIRKMVTVSGVILIGVQQLPNKMIWRDNPEKSDYVEPRLERFDRVQRLPFIRALNLYRYHE